jgi:hypothetical protein
VSGLKLVQSEKFFEKSLNREKIHVEEMKIVRDVMCAAPIYYNPRKTPRRCLRKHYAVEYAMEYAVAYIVVYAVEYNPAWI